MVDDTCTGLDSGTSTVSDFETAGVETISVATESAVGVDSTVVVLIDVLFDVSCIVFERLDVLYLEIVSTTGVVSFFARAVFGVLDTFFIVSHPSDPFKSMELQPSASAIADCVLTLAVVLFVDAFGEEEFAGDEEDEGDDDGNAGEDCRLVTEVTPTFSFSKEDDDVGDPAGTTSSFSPFTISSTVDCTTSTRFETCETQFVNILPSFS